MDTNICEKLTIKDVIETLKSKLPTLTQDEILNGFDLNVSASHIPFYVRVTSDEIKLFQNSQVIQAIENCL